MVKLIRASICTALVFFALTVCAQDTTHVAFRFSQERVNANEIVLKLHAKPAADVQLYTIRKTDAQQLYTSLTFDNISARLLTGAIEEKGNIQTATDKQLNVPVRFVTDSVEWQQKIAAKHNDSMLVKGTISYLCKKGDEFVSGEMPFRFTIERDANVTESQTGIAADKSLWWIFFTAFAGGLLALLTPCVYSMIPVTVSFFTKRSKSRAEGIRNALCYASSIIIIFTALGFLITVIFGPAALNNLATNWIANLVFFALFLLFGFSFLGAFDISLPSSWSSKADTKAGISSFAGIFFMALTLVIVSFSCTGLIIGNLLVLAAKGSYYGPLIGMLGFSTALALPFALFAFFPTKLNILGKAGGWLNAVKVTLGFLELALALKFLSNADLAKGWRLLDRDVFIGLWIVIFISLGLYLFGLIRFRHDDKLPNNDFDVPHLSVTRLLFAVASFYFAVYMIPGLWGAPLKGISAFVPPMGTQDFPGSVANVASTANHFSSTAESLGKPYKYADAMAL